MTCRSTTSSSQCTTSAQNGQMLSYDSAGRLVVWQDAPSNPSSTQTMAYDGEGNRVALQVNGGTPTYYLGSLEEISGDTWCILFTKMTLPPRFISIHPPFSKGAARWKRRSPRSNSPAVPAACMAAAKP